MITLRKGQLVTVRSSAGKKVECPLVDVDLQTNKLWVRLPGDHMLIMGWNPREDAYTGKLLGVDFTVDPEEN